MGRRRKKGNGGKGKQKRDAGWMALLEKGQEMLYSGDLALAKGFYSKAVASDPENIQLLQAYGEFLLEICELDAAKQVFQKCLDRLSSTAVDSESIFSVGNASVFLNLGQLMTGNDAISCYQKGIQLMESILPSLSSQQEILSLKSDISSALSACAEVHLTDNCFQDNAETDCEQLLQRALQYHPDSPDTLKVLADLRISQNRREEAVGHIRRCRELWDSDPSRETIPFGLRLNSAKIFIELSLFQEAIDILEELLEEDDSIPEVHYDLGIAYKSNGDAQSSQNALECSMELLQNDPSVELSEKEERLEQIRSLLEENTDAMDVTTH